MANNFETVKKEYKILLNDCLIENSIEPLKSKYKAFSKIPIDLKLVLDVAFRDYGLELLEKNYEIKHLKAFVKLSIAVCRKEMATPTIPVMLLADIFDSHTMEACGDMFTFVEEHVNVWKEELFFTSCKNNLLRMCNNLLRRLSRSSDTVFCGRILLFLAKFFPFSERSGLNIVSEFNLDNITEYGAADASEESVTEIDVGSKKNIAIDYSLYCKFWSLQDFFRNPNQCYNKVQWKLFCSHATNILSTFQGLKLDYVSKEGDEDDAGDAPYFPKYLTNQKLLDLQIYDVNFRRYILLQFLILFQYLTSSVKFKSDAYELKTDQKEWVQAVTEKVYTLLKETPPDGDKFAVIIKNILQREERWNVWKNDGCPEFKKAIPSVDTTEEYRSVIRERPLLGDVLKEAHMKGEWNLGSPELTKLWNSCPDNLEACKAKERDFLPSLDSYFEEAIAQLDDPTVKKEDSLLRDPNFGWRGLRLLARRSPHFFTYSNNQINQLPDYLETMVRKIAADRPGRVQETMETNEVELEENNLFKDEATNEDINKQETEEFADDHNPRAEALCISPMQLELFSKMVENDWKRLAVKLGYQPDEIKFFEDENPTLLQQAKNVLQLWFEDNMEATLENLAYVLEGLGMDEAAEAVKAELNSVES